MEPTPLDAVTAARWVAVRQALGALGESAQGGTVDEEGFVATLAKISSIDLDLPAVLDAVHLPADAGNFADGLKRIMGRIPSGWGRWIGHGPGWYELVTTLDTALNAIDPDYVVHQVKEKYGTLRFYAERSAVIVACCVEFYSAHPRPQFGAERSVWEPWHQEHDAHTASAEHLNIVTSLQEERASSNAVFDALISRAELLSGRIDESTATPGVVMASGGWFQTIDPRRAPAGYRIESGRRFVRSNGTFDVSAALVAEPDDFPWAVEDAKDDPAKLRSAALLYAAEVNHLQGVLADLHAAYAATCAAE